MNKEIFAQTDRLMLRKFNLYAYESAFSDSEVQRICLK